MSAIHRKVQGKEVSMLEAPTFSGGSNVVDLVEALKASLNSRGSKAADIKKRKSSKKARAPGEAASSKKSSRR